MEIPTRKTHQPLAILRTARGELLLETMLFG